MNRRFLVALRAHTILITLFLTIPLLTASGAYAQGDKSTQTPVAPTPENEKKAEQVVERAVKALGGDAYLNVRSLTAHGYFTQFKEGASGLPLTFVDYVIYPDRERTEFKGGGTRVIQTNTGDTGWLYDGQAKTLQDMSREQVEDFHFAIRTNVDYLLRGFWRKEGAKLSYVGRREAGLAKRNETIRLTYPDGLQVEYEFGAQDGLPAKVLYKKRTRDGAEIVEEDHFAQFVSVEGVLMPYIIDHFRAGAQASRINYDSVEINRPLSDSLFARPANAKAVK